MIHLNQSIRACTAIFVLFQLLSTNVSAAIAPFHTDQPPSLSEIKALCIPSYFKNAKVLEWNYIGGYLYCIRGDDYTAGTGLWKKLPNGKFIPVGGGGGDLNVPYLISKFHVPRNVAIPLYNGKHR